MDAPGTVDLNADVGEAVDPAGRRVELDLLDVVTTVHLACGGHAGDDESMGAIMAAARPRGVGVGAHPSYPDRAGFGRRPMTMEGAALAAALQQQIGACMAAATRGGVAMTSVKAHGALYAEVAAGAAACTALLEALGGLGGPRPAVVLPAGAPARPAVEAAGYRVLAEGFCDRAYAEDGTLVPRQEPGAVYDDPARAAEQALALAHRVDTLCLHGDSPGALAMALAVRAALTGAGITVAPPARPGS